MRLFFATDLHGSEHCFRKLLAARRFYSADAVVLGGDISGKSVQPILKVGNTYQGSLFGRPEFLESEAAVREFEERARRIGVYTVRVTPDELSHMTSDVSHMHSVEIRLVRERLERWLELASMQAGPIYFCPGNDDDPAIDSLMKSSPFIWIDRTALSIMDGFVLLGMGGSNYTPWQTPREYSDQELASMLDMLASTVGNWKKTICSIHAPPFDCGLDLAPELSPDLHMRTAPGFVGKKPIGSRSVDQFIRRFQPLLGLFGHVHEARGQTKLGRTLCVNPGSTYYEGILAGVVVTLGSLGVEDVQFTSG